MPEEIQSDESRKADWSTWALRALLTVLVVAALGMWNDVHDMKSDLRAHVAGEEKTNAFQDFRLNKHADLITETKDAVFKVDGRLRVAEDRLKIHPQ